MANMLMFAPAPGVVMPSHGTGADNLFTPDPKEVWSDNGGGGDRRLWFQLDSTRMIDTLFIGCVGGTGGANLRRWIGGPGNFDGPTHYDADTNPALVTLAPSRLASPRRRHLLFRLPAPVPLRETSIVVNSQTANTMTIGVVAFGLSLQTRYNRERGGGRAVIDTGARERLPGGGFGIGDGATKGAFRWTFGDLDDAEVDAIYEMGLDRGERRPLVVVEDPDATPGLNERIHYGLFERFEAYERRSVGRTRWSLGIEQWV